MSDWLKELKKKIVDPNVSDQEVYDYVFGESEHQTPQQGTLSQVDWQRQTDEDEQENERVWELMEKTRPQLPERIIKGLVEQHKNCCGPGCGNSN